MVKIQLRSKSQMKNKDNNSNSKFYQKSILLL